MVNSKYILKQKLLDSLEETYFKRQRQQWISYAKHTLAGLIQNLYDDYGKISLMDIEKIKHKMKQEWYLLYPIIDLFELI